MTMLSNRFAFTFLVFVSFGTFVCTEEEVPCQKISFDSEDKSNIERCPGVWLQELTKKEYSDTALIKPFREGTKYYLSNKNNGMSCEQTKETFFMDQNSIVQMTNILYLTEGAWLTVRIMDLDDLDEYGFPKVAYEWKLDGNTREWQIFNRTISKIITRGKVQMECNINNLSTLAIEHLHIINTAVGDDECQEEVWYPEATTTTVTSTSSSTSSSTSTTEEITTEIITTTTEELTTTTEKPETTTKEIITTTEKESTSTEIETPTEQTTTTENETTEQSETTGIPTTTEKITTESTTTTEEITSEITTESTTTEEMVTTTEEPETTTEEISTTTEKETTSTEIETTTKEITTTTEQITTTTENDTTDESTITTEETETTELETTIEQNTTEISTTEEITTITEEETTLTTELETTTDFTTTEETNTEETEITSTEEPTTTSNEISTTETEEETSSTTEISTETDTNSVTASSSTTETSPNHSDSNMLYLYLVLILLTALIIIGIIIFLFFLCKSDEENQQPTNVMSNTIPKQMNIESISSTSNFSIFSHKYPEVFAPGNQIPRLTINKNDSGLSSNFTTTGLQRPSSNTPSWIIEMEQQFTKDRAKNGKNLKNT